MSHVRSLLHSIAEHEPICEACLREASGIAIADFARALSRVESVLGLRRFHGIPCRMCTRILEVVAYGPPPLQRRPKVGI